MPLKRATKDAHIPQMGGRLKMKVGKRTSLSWNPSAIAKAFAASASTVGAWNTVTETAAAATASCEAMLLSVPQGKTLFRRPYPCGWIDDVLDQRGVSDLLRERVISNADYGKPEDLARPEREGIPWFAGVKIAAGGEVWCLLLQRSIEKGSFSRKELEELADLSLELSEAAAQAQLLGFARSHGALGVFDLLNLPAALLDRYGQLVSVNQAAEQLFGTNHAVDQLFGDDVTISEGHVRSRATLVLNQVLRTTVLNQALSDFLSSDDTAVTRVISLPRREDRRPLLVSAIRLSEISQSVFARCQTVLLFFDLDRHGRPPETVLRQCFGLSAAEARLAVGLASGESLKALAKQLNITKETARHELKSVFTKLNVHRQAELVALLSLLPQLATSIPR
jgi:DNA-binding CsgD family transcriptional regulator/PAS domain-containing protein